MKITFITLYLVIVLILAVNSCKKSPSLKDQDSDFDRDTILQIGNSLPQSQLLPWQPDSIVTNTMMGTGAACSQYDLPGWKDYLGEILNLGTKHVQTSLPEGEEPIDWDWPEDEFPWEYDQFIDGLNENGIIINYEIHFWDKAGHARGETLSVPRFQTADQIEDFLEYVRLIVGHYKGRVQYYTIWSEPGNCGGSGIKCIEPDDYINLLRQTVPVIHEEDPQAKVSVAAVVLYHAHDYLFNLLVSDIMPMVDVIQWHGLFDVVPNNVYYGNYYYEYPIIVEEIRQTATAHGFNGEYWCTGVTWSSDEFPDSYAPDHHEGHVKTDKEVAKYYSRSILMHLGMDVGFDHMGGVRPEASWSYPAIQNLYAIMAGATPTCLTVHIENKPQLTSTFAFTLPGGDLLFALWIDGVAAEHHPGIVTTLTFPGLSAQKVEGINVLCSFKQQLITSYEDGNLVIRDILIRDYPLIILFSDVSSR